jgi:hypothetical protein
MVTRARLRVPSAKRTCSKPVNVKRVHRCQHAVVMEAIMTLFGSFLATEGKVGDSMAGQLSGLGMRRVWP